MTSLAAYHRDVFAAASERMCGLIEFDAAVWLATDPATSLPTAPTRPENMGFVGGSYSTLHACAGRTDSLARPRSRSSRPRRLHLSPHTVRDYVKTIFEKVGVSSRGELVAKLFAEHYAPIHIEPGARERPR